METKVGAIYSKRHYEQWPSLHTVYEWEDVFSKELGLKLKRYNKNFESLIHYVVNAKTYPVYRVLNLKQITDKTAVAFIMTPFDFKYFLPRIRYGVLPIFIDFWGNHLELFQTYLSSLDYFYVTSKEIYNEVKKVKPNVKYMPLSIADIWKKNAVPAKSIDVIMIGRKNKVLHEYMEKLVAQFPKINYVYQTIINQELHYHSTQYGDMGVFQSREAYMDLLSKAKVSLVSSPGMDSSRDTGGINPVTPRFFESAANYCYMLGRYPNNADFIHCKVPEVCPFVNSYEEFEDYILQYLDRPFEQVETYNAFLDQHYTSRRARQLIQDLKGWGENR